MSSEGPLAGIKIIELEGIGPGPFTAMMLADLGANVLRIACPVRAAMRSRNPVLARGRIGTVTLDLKKSADVERLRTFIARTDSMIEGFRPTVMEKLGLGPEACMRINPRLIYGRVTGWGRTGPLSHTAGHDINYIALTGALHACGTAASGPIPPLNLVGDFGGGGLLLAFGMVCALLEARNSGRGQIVDAAMIDGAAILMSMIYGMRSGGRWPAKRAGNMLDGSAYFYTCYECSDGGWMAVGAIEPEFRMQLLDLLGLKKDAQCIIAAADDDPQIRQRLADIFRAKTRAEWQRIFDGTDACVSPVLHMDEVMHHQQIAAWGTVSVIDGVVHPNPAPRFSRTSPSRPGQHKSREKRRAQLDDWGLEDADLS
jgi:alpha-methylacyl-CoA racemase